MDLTNELIACKAQVESIHNNIVHIENNLDEIFQKYNDYDNQLKCIIESQQYYKKAIDIIYDRSIKELKDVLNSALSYIYFDRNYEMEIHLVDKRGKAIRFTILDNGREVNLKRGMGMGVKCVVSAILHIYYLQCKNSKILMLDEAYSNIDEEHLPLFFDFLSKLCNKLGFIITIITHDNRFRPYAIKLYKINKGVVTVGDL